ncbi:unnamed protein product [Gongylonema pulchrum]|uniref:Glutaredoxin domain-containing protein n=1 Tax=Gongylonema pulchrum TaxID=637853 RepID=A0A183EBX9_9BILA|nr:unnamed protein product [Gongylonema pulchrum]
MGASMGAVQMWGSNKTAKFLMPLLSKNKRMTAMAKVQEDAEAQGIEIPPFFSDIDEDSGMPKLFASHVEQDSVVEAVQEAVHRAETELQAETGEVFEQPLPKTVFYTMDTQTESPIWLVFHIACFYY